MLGSIRFLVGKYSITNVFRWITLKTSNCVVRLALLACYATAANADGGKTLAVYVPVCLAADASVLFSVCGYL